MNIVPAPTSSADQVDSRAMLLDGTVATLRVTGPADCSLLRRFFHKPMAFAFDNNPVDTCINETTLLNQ